jgi:hypothetical protein
MIPIETISVGDAKIYWAIFCSVEEKLDFLDCSLLKIGSIVSTSDWIYENNFCDVNKIKEKYFLFKHKLKQITVQVNRTKVTFGANFVLISYFNR